MHLGAKMKLLDQLIMEIFLVLLSFLSKYDSFLANHIEKYANKGTGHASYRSSTIYEEFVQIMATKVMTLFYN